MNDSTPPPAPPEPGRVVRPVQSLIAKDQTGWLRWLPGLHVLRNYQLAWLPHDVMAGLALTAVLVPVGIAYAVASGVPGICGLYATMAGLLAYALFGPSRILVLGPDSSLAALILAVVLPLASGSPQRAIALAGMMALVSGALCVAAGVARLGFVTELLSKPIRYGYMNGIALTVIASQLPALFGFSVDAHGLLDESRLFMAAVLAGKANLPALAIGAGTLLSILLLRGHARLPGVLIAVSGATLLVTLQGLAVSTGAHAAVPVLGTLPQGLPACSLPSICQNNSGFVMPAIASAIFTGARAFSTAQSLSNCGATLSTPSVNCVVTRIALAPLPAATCKAAISGPTADPP